MAAKKFVFWCHFLLLVVGLNASGRLAILYCPSTLRFFGNEGTKESFLKEIFSAALGVTVQQISEWKGLSLVDPFSTPEAAVVVYVDGAATLDDTNMKSYPLLVDDYEPDIFNALKYRIKQSIKNGDNKLVNINLSDPNDLGEFGEISLQNVKIQQMQHLQTSSDEDREFVRELQILKSITAKVNSGGISADNIVDFYLFKISSPHAIYDFYGPNSLQAKEVKTILLDELEELTRAFVKAYDGSVLVTALATDVAHTRRTIRDAPLTLRPVRAASQKQKAPNDDLDGSFRLYGDPADNDNPIGAEDTSPAQSETDADAIKSDTDTADKPDEYSSDHAAIFHIILWFSAGFTFSIVAVVQAFMDMDPGRNSVVYRMTTTKIMKD